MFETNPINRGNINIFENIISPMQSIQEIQNAVHRSDYLLVAKMISSIENNEEEARPFLASLAPGNIPVVGFTGPPGAGKSTLIASLIGTLVKAGKKVAVLSVDPSSVHHKGALLGDRIRMREWYLHPSVYIRSLASRGHLGGLIETIGQMTQMLKSVGFDMVILETVGVGQSEVQVASVADMTVLVLVPEAGDEIQMMKSGLFEVATIFVVNKSDRPEAKKFAYHLLEALGERNRPDQKTNVIETIATTGEGVDALFQCIQEVYGKLKA